MVDDPARAAVTSLNAANYQRLKTVCAKEGWKISRILDSVIEAFLDEAEAK